VQGLSEMMELIGKDACVQRIEALEKWLE
jgi:hypothetical protein